MFIPFFSLFQCTKVLDNQGCSLKKKSLNSISLNVCEQKNYLRKHIVTKPSDFSFLIQVLYTHYITIYTHYIHILYTLYIHLYTYYYIHITYV